MSLHQLFEKFNISERINEQAKDYIFNHTMLRVKDLKKSIEFYSKVLGFIPVYEAIFNDAEFTIVYLIRRDFNEIPYDDLQRKEWVLKQSGVLELTFNHGTEIDESFRYHDGNIEPRGFGHICISVPNLIQECKRFEALGVKFQKKLSEGYMNDVAFIKDPDGYWIELLQPTELK